EFSIGVNAQGDTQVVVYEGAVEVASLSDPSRRVLIEAGRGVLVRTGQNFHLLASAPPGFGNRDAGERGDGPDRDRQGGGPLAQNGPPGAGHGRPGAGTPMPAQPQAQAAHGREKASRRATASTYDRYVASLAGVQQ